MTGTTYDVRINKTEVYKGQRKVTHYVRWTVAGKRWRKGHATDALADSFRSQLVLATRNGEAFDIANGLPLSMRRTDRETSWYKFACGFADIKWPRVAATTRRTHAEALTALTVAMLTDGRNRPDAKLIRKALCRWAFNTVRRDDPARPAEISHTLRWVEKYSRPVSDLADDPAVLRAVLDSLTVKLDGKRAAASVINRRRKIFNAAVEYAVTDKKLLDANPIPALKWSVPRTVHAVDRRSVVNPVQGRTLLNAVGTERPSEKRFKAYYGCQYFAALRPEEAAGLNKANLALPAAEWNAEQQCWQFLNDGGGWGEIHLEKAEPYAGKEWTDSGDNRDSRQLKQREVGETRTVPCCPELTIMVLDHVRIYGTSLDGRLFVGERNRSELPRETSIRAWDRARRSAFTDEVYGSPLAKTPYDLRHACVSTWLNGGVPPTDVAAWAGHSVEILLKIYAKCLDGSAAALRGRVQVALGWRV